MCYGIVFVRKPKFYKYVNKICLKGCIRHEFTYLLMWVVKNPQGRQRANSENQTELLPFGKIADPKQLILRLSAKEFSCHNQLTEYIVDLTKLLIVKSYIPFFCS